uniref:Uncharacterized protein n=1 Tax=Meleagris gallopavo TaxID=9103 RepID=A0A803Y873_MELGA
MGPLPTGACCNAPPPVSLQVLSTHSCSVTAAEGARPVLFCATQDGLEPFSGCYFADCHPLQPWAQARDDAAARELWDPSHIKEHVAVRWP